MNSAKNGSRKSADSVKLTAAAAVSAIRSKFDKNKNLDCFFTSKKHPPTFLYKFGGAYLVVVVTARHHQTCTKGRQMLF